MASTVPDLQKPTSSPQSPVLGPSQSSKSVLFLDLEATCDQVKGEKLKYSLHEIIEIACISWSIGDNVHDSKILNYFNLTFQGRLHSALDDVKNLHQVFSKCMALGWDMKV